jgi:hypothetical protein
MCVCVCVCLLFVLFARPVCICMYVCVCVCVGLLLPLSREYACSRVYVHICILSVSQSGCHSLCKLSNQLHFFLSMGVSVIVSESVSVMLPYIYIHIGRFFLRVIVRG